MRNYYLFPIISIYTNLFIAIYNRNKNMNIEQKHYREIHKRQ